MELGGYELGLWGGLTELGGALKGLWFDMICEGCYPLLCVELQAKNQRESAWISEDLWGAKNLNVLEILKI